MAIIQKVGKIRQKSFRISDPIPKRQKINPQLALQVVDNLPVEFAVYDLNNCYTFINELYIDDPEFRVELIGKNDDYLFRKLGINNLSLEHRKKHFNKAVKERKRISFTEKLFYQSENKTKYYKCYFQPLFKKDKLSGVCLYGNDLTAVILGQKELKYLAYHDKITELENREAFNSQLDQIFNEIPRSNEDSTIALLLCTIDGVKNLNDMLGRENGDKILKEVGERIKTRLRKTDRIFRYGGIEFTVISKYLKNEADAEKIAEKIIESVKEPYSINGKKIDSISINIGIGILPKDGKDRVSVIKNADTAMQTAKIDGKNHFCFFSNPVANRL